MTYLVSKDGSDEPALEMAWYEVLGFLELHMGRKGFLANGEALLIRRADYLDTDVSNEVSSDRPKLTLLRGGIE